MGSISSWHLLIVLAALIVLLAGRGGISKIMADFAQGIEAFKQGLGNKDDPAQRPSRRGLSPGLLLMAVVALAITIAAYVKTLQQN